MAKANQKLKEAAQKKGKPKATWIILGIIVVIAIAAIAYTVAAPKAPDAQDFGVSREKYFREAFQPDRTEYKLFEKAAAYTKKPVSALPAFFNIKSETDIFAVLPKIPKDFSETAYLLASGKYFSIGFLEGEYYLQPEFYPGFKENGLRYWEKPDPTSWGVTGYGSYPAEQDDVLTVGGRENFTAVVFFYAGYGIQTYQGVALEQDSNSKKYFDVSVSPKNFLLDPTFPKFGKDWAQKIVVTGRLKAGTKPGKYVIGLNVETPPNEVKTQWELAHKNLYYDAASGIRPGGNQIELQIRVE